MSRRTASKVVAPEPPVVRLGVGVTGHRFTVASADDTEERIARSVRTILAVIQKAASQATAVFGPGYLAPPRLHTLLAEGADQLVTRESLSLGWSVAAILPFGRALNAAINARPVTGEDVRRILSGLQPEDAAAAARLDAITALSAQSSVFELADQDEAIAADYIASLDTPSDPDLSARFTADISVRAALAAQVLIAHSDIIIAIWDGRSTTLVGGTGHTVATALDMSATILWINPASPEHWRILRTPESLAARDSLPAPEDAEAQLESLIRAALEPEQPNRLIRGQMFDGLQQFNKERWRTRSNPLWYAYRTLEVSFGGKDAPRRLGMHYEPPSAIATGSGAAVLGAMRSASGAKAAFADRVDREVLHRFAWADGVSSSLSDTYRGGMVAGFALAALAVVVGLTPGDQLYTALLEMCLLVAIISITVIGQRLHWHERWFESRRVAEYLRHGPLMLALGAIRPQGRWPRGSTTSWPEWYARYALRAVGLPETSVTRPYLRDILHALRTQHVLKQRDYHFSKARRLTGVHNSLDRLSTMLFALAFVAVAASLLLSLAADMTSPPQRSLFKSLAGAASILSVLLPALGSTIAGVRYFGDFERFAAISEATAVRLDAIQARIELLLQGDEKRISYGLVSDLAQAIDDIVVTEIENWQAVFGGKHVAVPV